MNSGWPTGRQVADAATPGRIVVLRALPGLGDLLCAVPAWRALRAAYPQAQITLIGLPATRPLVDRFARYIDGFLCFPGYPGLGEGKPCLPTLLRFLERVQGRFDLALQMHGSGVVSNCFTMLLGARRAGGFFMPGQYCPDPATFRPYPTQLSEVHRCLELLASFGIPARGDRLEFPLGLEDRVAFYRLKEARTLRRGDYVCLHPGASEASKRWPVECFAAVGEWLAARGLQIVLTGTAAEKRLTRAVARAMERPVVDLAGRTTVGALAILLQKARLLICNDTGVSHLAAAMRTPSVVIFPTPDVERWAPLDRQRHRALGPGDNGAVPARTAVTCATDQPPHWRYHPPGHATGNGALPPVHPTAVLDAATTLLQERANYAA